MTRLTRAVEAGLELRGGDGRTVTGLAAPFDSPTEIHENGRRITEVIRRGAFKRTIAERGGRVKFLAQHNTRAMPLGRASVLREDPRGLYMEARISQTRAGDEALSLIEDGALDGLSIGFEIVRDDFDPDTNTLTLRELKLHEISLVNFPAYSDALVSGVRSQLVIPFAVAERRLRLIELD
jgi:HK97 family phage prohead protease